MAPTKPYARIVVPKAFGELTGDYLRLGPFVGPDEAAPTLQWSKSKLTVADVEDSEPSGDLSSWIDAANQVNIATQADEDKETYESAVTETTTFERDADGNLVLDAMGFPKTKKILVKNKSSQRELKSISTDTTSHPSEGDGIFVSTLSDVNVKSAGATLLDVGKGFTVQTAEGDVVMNAVKGAIIVSSKSGIQLTAGNSTDPANIALVAYGYIKQTAYGPVSDWKYSTSTSKTYGWSKDYFYGEKYSEFRGKSTSKFWGVEEKYYNAEQRNFNLAGRVNLTLAGNMTIQMSFDFTLTVGINTSILIGGQIAVVFPFRMTVLGQEVKIVNWNDFKICGNDFKVVGGVDQKVVGSELKVGGAKVFATAINARTKNLDALKVEAVAKINPVQATVTVNQTTV